LILEANMSVQVNIHEAKTHLSKLLERVMSGEKIIIAKAGKPVAQIVPLTKTPTRAYRRPRTR